MPLVKLNLKPYWKGKGRDPIRRATWIQNWLKTKKGKQSRRKTYNKYYVLHLEERKELSSEIQKRTKGKAQKDWILKNPEKRSIIDYNYNHSENRKKQLQSKEYKEKKATYDKNYSRTSHGKLTRLKANRKQLQTLVNRLKEARLCKTFTMFEFQYAIRTWAKYIIIRDKNCQTCGSKENLIAHHLFYKAMYPELSLNENNGICLCKECHYELHFNTIRGDLT